MPGHLLCKVKFIRSALDFLVLKELILNLKGVQGQ